MPEQKRRVGRPTKTAKGRQKKTLSIRVTTDLANRLDRAAKKYGRSLSQEAELRFEKSFDLQSHINEILLSEFGGERELTIFRAMSAMAASIDTGLGSRGWLDDYVTFATVRNTWTRLLEKVGPEEPPERKKLWDEFSRVVANLKPQGEAGSEDAVKQLSEILLRMAPYEEHHEVVELLNQMIEETVLNQLARVKAAPRKPRTDD
jgi:hypothetical protein